MFINAAFTVGSACTHKIRSQFGSLCRYGPSEANVNDISDHMIAHYNFERLRRAQSTATRQTFLGWVVQLGEAGSLVIQNAGATP
eukprot:6184209-Pleurochrysis_carterae.AAC.2